MDVTQDSAPLPSGTNGGRDEAGRFGAGNKCSVGHRGTTRAARWRRVIDEATDDADIREAYLAIVAMAKGGDVAAWREMRDLGIGRIQAALEDDDQADAPLIIEPPLPMAGVN